LIQRHLFLLDVLDHLGIGLVLICYKNSLSFDIVRGKVDSQIGKLFKVSSTFDYGNVADSLKLWIMVMAA
jgi:hypothetical protein